METGQIITATVAVYGALLSSFLAILTFREKRRILKVSAGMGLMTHRPGPPFMTINAVNPGHLPVIIKNVGYWTPDKKSRHLITHPISITLPHELKAGDSCVALIDAREVVQLLRARGWTGTVNIFPFCEDGTGRHWRGAPYGVDTSFNP